MKNVAIIALQALSWLGALALLALGPATHAPLLWCLLALGTGAGVAFYDHPYQKLGRLGTALGLAALALWVVAWRSGWAPAYVGPLFWLTLVQTPVHWVTLALR